MAALILSLNKNPATPEELEHKQHTASAIIMPPFPPVST
jgi:hypothetical protein